MDQITSVIDIYRKRWLIEEYFKAIKIGCGFEKRQLESKKALLNAMAFFSPIAWQMLRLREMQRSYPQELASRVLNSNQIEVLRTFGDKLYFSQPLRERLRANYACELIAPLKKR